MNMEPNDEKKKNGRNRPPAFMFYAMDWLTDPSLRLCDPETRGIWIDLLCYMFLSNRPGYLMINDIILDEKMIQKYSGIEPKRFKRIWNELVKYDIIKKDENGIYYSKRMIDDERIRQIRKECGTLGGNPKLMKKVKQKQNQMDNHMDNQNINQNQSPSYSYSNSNSNDENNILTDHQLNEWIKMNCPNVTKLKQQMTSDECEKIIIEHGNDIVKSTLENMENYKKLNSNYVSVYLTLNNWIKKNKQNNGTKNAKKSFTDTIKNW